MQLNIARKPRGKKWVAVVGLLLVLFGMAASTVWRANPTIHFLGYVDIGAVLFLFGVLVRSGRRAAGAGGERPEYYSEMAEQLVRLEKKVGIGLVLLGLILFAALSLSWVTGIVSLAVVTTGILFISDSFNRFMRIVGIALVPLNVFFIGCLYLDAVHGHDKVWPLYTFVACGLISGLVWSYLLGKALFRWLSR